MYHDLKSRY
jgi:hypothetical protein